MWLQPPGGSQSRVDTLVHIMTTQSNCAESGKASPSSCGVKQWRKWVEAGGAKIACAPQEKQRPVWPEPRSRGQQLGVWGEVSRHKTTSAHLYRLRPHHLARTTSLNSSKHSREGTSVPIS